MEKKTIGSIILAIVLIVAAIYIYTNFGGQENRPGDNRLGYYFDTNTKELFVRDGTLRPPIEAPSGPDENGNPAGVRAYVYGKPDGSKDDVMVAFLEYEVEGGAMISAPDQLEWYSVISQKGTDIRKACTQRCYSQGYTKRVYPQK
jgi:hypothetical protein